MSTLTNLGSYDVSKPRVREGLQHFDESVVYDEHRSQRPDTFELYERVQ